MALECRALERVRETLGFANVIVMVPFCRTPAEADVLAAMGANGLKRGEAGLEVYMMCEYLERILADAFASRPARRIHDEAVTGPEQVITLAITPRG